MARMGGVLICMLIVIMDVVAGVLGIEAQIAQDKVLMVHINYKSSLPVFSFTNLVIEVCSA